MSPRAKTLLIAMLGLIIVFIAAGCLQRLTGGSSLFEDDYRDNLGRSPIAYPNASDICKEGSCWCMVCKNGTNIFGPLNNLIGGHCFWDKNCTPAQTAYYNNQSSTPDLTIRHFMIGAGPSFGDFLLANSRCSDRLSMSVQWLLGDNVTPYTRPDAARTMCFLSSDVMPVYILYSNGTNINITRTRQIGEILGTEGDDVFLGRLSDGPVGPVIVVTEIDFDASRAAEVANQVRALDESCRNDRANNKIYCHIAVAPKLNDFAALNAVHQELSADWDKVDFVAYGVNGKYVRGCEGAQVRQQATNFSRYILYNLSKPSLIPYVMFEPGASDLSGTCNWTEADVVAGYGSFFPFAVQSLQKRGVVGIAPYATLTASSGGVTNPLNCTNCGVGASQARLQAWYGGCQAYTNVTRPSGSNPSASTQIVFGNESGTVCNQNTNMDFIRGFSFAGRDIMQQAQGNMSDPAPLLFSCDACQVTNMSVDVGTLFPSLAAGASSVPSRSHCPYTNETLYPEFEQWSGARNLDPMIARAFAFTESRFDPCAAAKVCNAGYDGPGCFEPGTGKDECYDKAYDEMYDPAGNCTFEIAGNANTDQPDFRYCAVGIMQSLEPPYTFWPAWYHPDGANGPYFDVYQRSGFYSAPPDENDTRLPMLDMARSCSRSFNPFVPADSICVGTAKIEQMMVSARSWINAHRGQLNWGAGNVDKDNVFQVYVAGNMYAGFWGQRVGYSHPRCAPGVRASECWASGFAEAWSANQTYCESDEGQADSEHCHSDGTPIYDPPEKCNGATDFIAYVAACEVPYLPRQADPGKNKAEAFLSFTMNCPVNFCPPGKVMLDAICNPAYGDINPRYCLGPNQPKLPSSGTPFIPDLPACSTISMPPVTLP